MELWKLWERFGYQLSNSEIMARNLDAPLDTVHIDVDSTLLNLMGPWYKHYNAAHGDDLTPDKVLSWDVHLYAKGGKAVYKYITPAAYAETMPLPGAVEVTRRLAMRYNLVVLTTSSDSTHQPKVERLRRFFPWLENIVRKDENKHEVDGIQLLIDDGAHNFGGDYAGLLLDYAHNRQWKPRRGVARIREPYWQTIERLLLCI